MLSPHSAGQVDRTRDRVLMSTSLGTAVFDRFLWPSDYIYTACVRGLCGLSHGRGAWSQKKVW